MSNTDQITARAETLKELIKELQKEIDTAAYWGADIRANALREFQLNLESKLSKLQITF